MEGGAKALESGPMRQHSPSPIVEITYAKAPLGIGLKPWDSGAGIGAVLKGFRRDGAGQAAAAELSSLVAPGDAIVSVDGVSVRDQPFTAIVERLQRISYPASLSFTALPAPVPEVAFAVSAIKARGAATTPRTQERRASRIPAPGRQHLSPALLRRLAFPVHAAAATQSSSSSSSSESDSDDDFEDAVAYQAGVGLQVHKLFSAHALSALHSHSQGSGGGNTSTVRWLSGVVVATVALAWPSVGYVVEYESEPMLRETLTEGEVCSIAVGDAGAASAAASAAAPAAERRRPPPAPTSERETLATVFAGFSSTLRTGDVSHAAQHADIGHGTLAKLGAKLRAASYTAHGSDLSALFARFDDDHNGTLSVGELGRHLTKLLPGVITTSELRALCASFDVNGDGIVDSQEFALWCTQGAGKAVAARRLASPSAAAQQLRPQSPPPAAPSPISTAVADGTTLDDNAAGEVAVGSDSGEQRATHSSFLEDVRCTPTLMASTASSRARAQNTGRKERLLSPASSALADGDSNVASPRFATHAAAKSSPHSAVSRHRTAGANGSSTPLATSSTPLGAPPPKATQFVRAQSSPAAMHHAAVSVPVMLQRPLQRLRRRWLAAAYTSRGTDLPALFRRLCSVHGSGSGTCLSPHALLRAARCHGFEGLLDPSTARGAGIKGGSTRLLPFEAVEGNGRKIGSPATSERRAAFALLRAVCGAVNIARGGVEGGAQGSLSLQDFVLFCGVSDAVAGSSASSPSSRRAADAAATAAANANAGKSLPALEQRAKPLIYPGGAAAQLSDAAREAIDGAVDDFNLVAAQVSVDDTVASAEMQGEDAAQHVANLEAEISRTDHAVASSLGSAGVTEPAPVSAAEVVRTPHRVAKARLGDDVAQLEAEVAAMRAELGSISASGVASAVPVECESEDSPLDSASLEREIEAMRADLSSLGVSVGRGLVLTSVGDGNGPQSLLKSPSYCPPPLPLQHPEQEITVSPSQVRFLRRRLCSAARSHYGAEVTLQALFARFGLGNEVSVEAGELGALIQAMLPRALDASQLGALVRAAIASQPAGGHSTVLRCHTFLQFCTQDEDTSDEANDNAGSGRSSDALPEPQQPQPPSFPLPVCQKQHPRLPPQGELVVGARVVLRVCGSFLNGTIRFIGPTEFSVPQGGRNSTESSGTRAVRDAITAVVYGVELDAPPSFVSAGGAGGAFGAGLPEQGALLKPAFSPRSRAARGDPRCLGMSASAVDGAGVWGAGRSQSVSFASKLVGCGSGGLELCDGQRCAAEARYFRTRGGATSGCFVRRSDIERVFCDWDDSFAHKCAGGSGSAAVDRKSSSPTVGEDATIAAKMPRLPYARRRSHILRAVPPPTPLAPNLTQTHGAARRYAVAVAKGEMAASTMINGMQGSGDQDETQTYKGNADEEDALGGTVVVRWDCAAAGSCGSAELVAQQLQHFVRRGNDDETSATEQRHTTPLSSSARSHCIHHLSQGQTYAFRVRAANAFGWGEWSPVTCTCVCAPPPGIPAGLRAAISMMDARGNSSRSGYNAVAIEAVWEPLEHAAFAPVTQYRLEFRPCGGTSSEDYLQWTPASNAAASAVASVGAAAEAAAECERAASQPPLSFWSCAATAIDGRQRSARLVGLQRGTMYVAVQRIRRATEPPSLRVGGHFSRSYA